MVRMIFLLFVNVNNSQMPLRMFLATIYILYLQAFLEFFISVSVHPLVHLVIPFQIFQFFWVHLFRILHFHVMLTLSIKWTGMLLIITYFPLFGGTPIELNSMFQLLPPNLWILLLEVFLLKLERHTPKISLGLLQNIAQLFGINKLLTTFGHPSAGIGWMNCRLACRNAEQVYRDRWTVA